MSRPAASRATSCAERRSRRRSALQGSLRPFLLLLCLLALAPAAASAHAQLISLSPADGAVVAVSPTAMVVTFNEPIGLATGGLQVVDGAGTVMDQGEESVDGPTITQPLSPLPDGWYVVTWGVVSEDGHIVRSSSVFGVGDADAAARPDTVTSGDAPITLIARFASDLGLVMAAGAWAAWWLLGARTPSVRRLALGSTTVALGATVIWGLIEVIDGGSGWLAAPVAGLTVLRVVLLAVATLPIRRPPGVPAIAVAAAVPTLAGGGHSAGDPFAMLLLGVHLLAAVVWLGAAPAVLTVLRSTSHPDADAIGVVRRFSRTAGFALVAIGVAGAALTWNLSDGLAGGLATPWALTMAAKVALVGLAALLGAVGRRHLGRSPDRRRLTSLFAIDAGLLVAVAAVSSLLTLNGPHVGHAGHGGAGDSRCSATVGERSVSIIATPGRVGTNSVIVGGIPSDVRAVTLAWQHELTQGGALRMEAAAADTGWAASGSLPVAGDWEVTVAVRVDSFTQESGSCALSIEP